MANATTQKVNDIKQGKEDQVIFSVHSKQNAFDPNFKNPYFMIKVILTPSKRLIYTNFPIRLIQEGKLVDYLRFIRTSFDDDQIIYCKKHHIDLVELPDDYEYPQQKNLYVDLFKRRYDYSLNEHANLKIENVGETFLRLCDLIPDSWNKALKDFRLGQGGSVSRFQKLVLYKMLKEINDGNNIK